MSKTEPRFDNEKRQEVAAEVARHLLQDWHVAKGNPFHDTLANGLTIKIGRLLGKMSTLSMTHRLKNSELKGCSELHYNACVKAAEEAYGKSETTLGMIIADELCLYHDMPLKAGKGLLRDYYALAAYYDADLNPAELLKKLLELISGLREKKSAAAKELAAAKRAAKKTESETAAKAAQDQKAAQEERIEVERLKAEKAEAERAENERSAKIVQDQKAEAERIEAGKLKKEQAEAERTESERAAKIAQDQKDTGSPKQAEAGKADL